MTTTYPTVDLGPLPKRNTYKANEARSIEALNAALPKEWFRYVDERQNDEGVDGSIELLTEANSLNLCAQVQLKSKAKGKPNADGSISVRVKVSNLNYVLNGPSPMYVLYVVNTRELRFVWAREEQVRLNQADLGWMSQKKITLRFVERLTPQALVQIYQRILNAGRTQRQIQERLARATTGEPVRFSIDPQTLTLIDPAEVYDRLATSGLSIVSAGYGELVLKQVELLDPEATRSPRIQLVKAYALSTQGRYLMAVALLQEVRLREGDLPPDDRHFATYLRDCCEYASGRIGLDEYGQRRRRWEDEEAGGYALAYRSYELYQLALAESDPLRRGQILVDISRVTGELLRHDEIPAALKLQARIELLYLEGNQLSFHSLRDIFLGQGPGRGGPGAGTSALQSLEDRWTRWGEEAVELTRQAVASRHPYVIASALSTHAAIITERLECIVRVNVLRGESFNLPEESIELGLRKAERALDIYTRANALDGELRCKLLMADLYILAGQDERAQEIAREVLPKAEAFGDDDLKVKAEDYAAGRTLLTRCEEMRSQLETDDPDVGLAAMSDDEIRRFARLSPVVTERGEDWLPTVEREFRSQRDAARERLDWCRHLNLLQQGGYARDPGRKCACERFGHQSQFGNSDWQAVISAFKQAYCAGCPDRDPKRPAPGTKSSSRGPCQVIRQK